MISSIVYLVECFQVPCKYSIMDFIRYVYYLREVNMEDLINYK